MVPTSGRFGGIYVQAISKYAPHPNAAKLWMEYLYSDEGQAIWMKGYCHTIRYDDLVAKNLVSAELIGKLPDVAGAVFPIARPGHGGEDADHHAVGRPSSALDFPTPAP